MSVTFHRGTFWYLRCPYHANVMKMLEKINKMMVIIGDVQFLPAITDWFDVKRFASKLIF